MEPRAFLGRTMFWLCSRIFSARVSWRTVARCGLLHQKKPSAVVTSANLVGRTVIGPLECDGQRVCAYHLPNLLFVVLDMYLINNTLKNAPDAFRNSSFVVSLTWDSRCCVYYYITTSSYHSPITAFIVCGALESVVYIVRLLFEPTYWRLEFCCISEMVS